MLEAAHRVDQPGTGNHQRDAHKKDKIPKPPLARVEKQSAGDDGDPEREQHSQEARLELDGAAVVLDRELTEDTPKNHALDQ